MAPRLATLEKRIAKIEAEAGDAHDRWVRTLSQEDLDLAIAGLQAIVEGAAIDSINPESRRVLSTMPSRRAL